MALDLHESICRFLLLAVQKSVHRIRRYGLLASSQRAGKIECARALLGATKPAAEAKTDTATPNRVAGADLLNCLCCGSHLAIIKTFLRGETLRHRATPRPLAFRIDTPRSPPRLRVAMPAHGLVLDRRRTAAAAQTSELAC